MSGYIFFHGKHIRFLVTTLPPEMPLVSGSPAFLWLRKFDPFFLSNRPNVLAVTALPRLAHTPCSGSTATGTLLPIVLW